jgi:hypothetical protein
MLLELTRQALCSNRRGYDLLAPKFDATLRTPDAILEPVLHALGPVEAALDLCCGTGAAMRVLQPLSRQRLAHAPGAPTPEWVEADVLTLTFRAEFNLITCFGRWDTSCRKTSPPSCA